MGLVQIALIWGAASAALFSIHATAGEYEAYKDLRAALVRSEARRDIPLPPWAARLEYKRPDFWYWTTDFTGKQEQPAKPEKESSKETPKHADKD